MKPKAGLKPLKIAGVKYDVYPSIDNYFGAPPTDSATVVRKHDKDNIPHDRVSILGGRWLASTPEQWRYYDGLGWAHENEHNNIVKDYTECFFSKKWVSLRHSLLVTVNMPHGEEYRYGRTELMKSSGYGLDCMSDRAMPIADLVEVFLDADLSSLGYINKAEVLKRPPGSEESRVAICAIENKLMLRRRAVPVKGSDTLMVSRLGIGKIEGKHNNKFGLRICERCGGVFVRDAVQPREEFGNLYHCDACYKKRMEENVVRAHDDVGYPPAIHHFVDVRRGDRIVKKANPRLFGVEIEMGFDDKVHRAKIAMDVVNVLGKDFIFAKHDGSIVRNDKTCLQGLEIVSAPASIEIHRERWPAFEKALHYKRLRSWDTKSCGFHVHITRESLSTLQIGRILVFINHPKNRDFIEKVAGRSVRRWNELGIEKGFAKFAARKLSSALIDDQDKYLAVRTNLEHTIEFRFFRGTVRPRHIIRNIEFSNAVCDFCNPAGRSFAEINDYRNFIAFINDNRKFYPMFAEWAATVDFIKKRKVKPGEKPLDVEEAFPPNDFGDQPVKAKPAIAAFDPDRF